MRSALPLILLAACGSPRKPPAPSSPPPSGPMPDGTMVADASAFAVAAETRPASPTACGALNLSAAPPATCTPHVLAAKADGALRKVWESPCPIYGLRDDGAVEIANQYDHYTLDGEPLRTTVASKLQSASTVAGTQVFVQLARPDGTRLLASGPHCEAFPLAPQQYDLAGTDDGRLFYWANEDERGAQLVTRAAAGTWTLAPPVRPGVYLASFTQNGRIAFGYQDNGTSGTEVGYYDVDSGQLRPIRRGGSPSGVQLAPGLAPGEPPSALYSDTGKTILDLPDATTGYRSLELPLPVRGCPDGGMADASKTPTGSFEEAGNAILVRTAAGGMHVAYTDVIGHCTYRYVDGYGAQRTRESRELFAHPPPPPPRWVIDLVPERASLVIVPVEGARWGTPKKVALPVRSYRYAGPWQFHPAVTSARIRLAIGEVLLDLDPSKLGSTPPLASPWVASASTTAPPPALLVPTPSSAEPFPALRPTTIAPLVMTAGPAHRVAVPRAPGSADEASCLVTPRAAPAGAIVARQLVLACGQARALNVASGDGRIAFTQFSQGGNEPFVELAADGAVKLAMHPAQPFELAIHYEKGAFVLGAALPAGATPPESGWVTFDADAKSIFGMHYNRGNELLRGTPSKTTPGGWDWAPAFPDGRTPPSGAMNRPAFVRHARGEPTIVYSSDPHDTAQLDVRLPGGLYKTLPAWGTGHAGGDRLDAISAAALAGSDLPVVASKIDQVIVVGVPEASGAYVMRTIAGTESFAELTAIPPGAAATPVASPHGPACSETVAIREREEVYSPQLFTWGKTVGLAFLSNRVREKLRYTVVAPSCGWTLDARITSPELVIARLDGASATEVARIPAAYRASNGFHGSNLLLSLDGSTLHTLATSYGLTTYTRITLP